MQGPLAVRGARGLEVALMTQPERSEVNRLLFRAIDVALEQIERYLPEGVRICLEVDMCDGQPPLLVEYSNDAGVSSEGQLSVA